MRHLIFILALGISCTVLAQSNYEKGFINGFKKGYCHDQGVGCQPPIPPVAPIPKVEESSSNYTHGYNRGFQKGLIAQQSGNTRNNSREIDVSTSKFNAMTYDEIMSVPMYLQKKYEENEEYLYALLNWVMELKLKIKEQKFIDRLNGEYSVLESMKNDDLARASRILKERELSIRRVILEYNEWLRKQN